jgi:hypothetical protein
LAPQVINLTALGFDLALLLLNLALGLIVLDLLILHLVADRIAANRADAAADSCARCRMAHGRADYRARTGANQRAAARPHLTIGEGLPITSAKEKRNCKRHSGSRNQTFTHLSYLVLPRLSF